MKLLFLTNSLITRTLSDWLSSQGHTVIIFEDQIYLEIVKADQYDLVISYNYKFIIKKDVIDYMQGNIVNLHISYLPWNRGSFPNYWSFINDTPKGVTLHYVDETLDTGDVIVRAFVDLSQEKTFEDSYLKLHEELKSLFKTAFLQYHFWKIIAVPQQGKGSSHTKKEFFEQAGKQFDWTAALPYFRK